MKNWDIQKILPLLKECGETALKYYDNPPIEIKTDKSIVTAADKEKILRYSNVRGKGKLEVFDLKADSPTRWKLRGYAIAAPDDKTINFILNNSNLPEL